MKPTTKLNKAIEHYEKSKNILDNLSVHLGDVLEDSGAHFSISPSDGLIITFNYGLETIAACRSIDIDKLMKTTDKDEMLDMLKQAEI